MDLMIRLEELRRQRGLSQTQMADVLQISQQAYSNYENGKRKPDYEMLIKIADFFETTTDWILGNSDERFSLNKNNSLSPEKLKLLKGIGYAYCGGAEKELTNKDVDDILDILKIAKRMRENRKNNGDQ